MVVVFIKLKGAGMRYKKQSVLHDVDLTIADGDIIGIIGKSGSGKTTLLNLIAGFMEPSEGEVVYVSKVNNKEKSLYRNLGKIKKYVGFTPQHNSFYHKLTVLENLLHFGKLYKLDKNTLNANVKALLEVTRLKEHRHKLADQLSGGMQKRLDIACSLVHKPKILILDEPTGDLDPVLRRETLNFLQEVNKQGVTLVIASHQLDSVEMLCNKIAVIHNGHVHSQGAIQEIRKPFLRDHFVINIHSPRNKDILIEALRNLPLKKLIDKNDRIIVYPENVGETMTKVMEIIAQQEVYLPEVNIQHRPLNDIFEIIMKE
tara:strand:- start:7797 stop:8744 length:948 start_codon:yes stop_codon:yes gene_type:complete